MNTSKPANGSEPECDAGPCLNASNPPAHPSNAQPETLGFIPGDNDSTSGATPQPPAPTTDQQHKPAPKARVPTPQQTTPASPPPPHAPLPILIAPRKSDRQQASGAPEGPSTPTCPKRRKSQISAPASSNTFKGTFKNEAGDDFIEIKTEKNQAAATQLGQLYADIFKRAVLSNKFISDSSEDEVKVNVVEQAGLSTMCSSIVKEVSTVRNANVAGDDLMGTLKKPELSSIYCYTSTSAATTKAATASKSTTNS
ncbi:hypothetical protein BDR26DRAFT_937048 [Obelidium mucronatum]|nr:hypothetical protein BDR26DRAFT_937048 [Obelidium mucronatum]